MTARDEIAAERSRLPITWPVWVWCVGVLFGPLPWLLAPWHWRLVSADRRRYALVRAAAMILAEIERGDDETLSEIAT